MATFEFLLVHGNYGNGRMSECDMPARFRKASCQYLKDSRNKWWRVLHILCWLVSLVMRVLCKIIPILLSHSTLWQKCLKNHSSYFTGARNWILGSALPILHWLFERRVTFFFPNLLWNVMIFFFLSPLLIFRTAILRYIFWQVWNAFSETVTSWWGIDKEKRHQIHEMKSCLFSDSSSRYFHSHSFHALPSLQHSTKLSSSYFNFTLPS